MQKNEESLFPHVKVTACPKCRFKFNFEPYIKAGDNSSSPVLGLSCGRCGYTREAVLVKGLPLQIDHANAAFGAMYQLVKISFLYDKNINVMTMEIKGVDHA